MCIKIYKDSKVEPQEVKRLFASVNWEEESKLEDSAIDAAFNYAYCSFVARKEGDLVGVIRATFDGVYVMLWNLVVHPQFQDQGLGTELLQLIMDEMEKRGHRWIIGLAVNERVDYYSTRNLQPVKHLTVVSTYSQL